MNNALIDFLYSDHERVASFLAQILGSGAPKGSERAGSKGRSSKQNAGLDFGIVKAGLEGERDWNQEVRISYDPLWSNSKRLVDEIRERQELSGSSGLSIGELRIFEGKLLCFDYSLINGFLASSSAEDLLADGMAVDNPDKKTANAIRQEKKRLSAVLREFLRSMPLGIGFVLVTDHHHFWFNVKREYLSLHALDIPLKFPVHVSGRWQVLGIVDALPEDHFTGGLIEREIDGVIPAMAVNFLQITGTMVAQFGRPHSAWGLSPLAIFRDVQASLGEWSTRSESE